MSRNKYRVIVIDKHNSRHLAEVLTTAEFEDEGHWGCQDIARVFADENGIAYRDWKLESVSNDDQQQEAA